MKAIKHLEQFKHPITRQKTKGIAHPLHQIVRTKVIARYLARLKGSFLIPCFSNLTARLLVFILLWQAMLVPCVYTADLRSIAERRVAKKARTTADTFAASVSSMDKRDIQLNPQAEAVEAAVVRHAPTFNGQARVEGAVRQLTGEDVTLNGSVVITSALLLPGTPELRLNGNPNFGGTVEGTGSAQPSGYRVSLSGNVTLGKLVTRVDPIPLPTVAPPPQSAGTRNVTINQSGQNPGDFATLRDLTLNGNVGSVAVPPGTYRNFAANGGGSFVFGAQGATEAVVYNLNSLTLNGASRLLIAGPVVLTLASSLTLNGMAGASTDPRLLTLRIASGGVTLNGGSSLYAVVQAPSGTVNINGNSLLQGSLACDRLTINGNGMLKGTEGVLQSLSPLTATQGQTLRVTLRGRNTHWVAGLTRASFGGEVSVGGAEPGEPGLVQVTDPFTAVADLIVSPTAALAPRSARVMTPVFSFDEGETEVLIDAFKVAAASAPGAASSQVSTLAGLAGSPGFADGAVSQARFRDLAGIAIGSDDTIYVADAGNHRIRIVRPAGLSGSAVVSTLAGDGTAGFADGPGATARFNNPQGVAVAPSGVVYVADTGNHRIRRIATDGTVTILAGNGTSGFENGQGNQARFNSPSGIAIDAAGNLFVADTGNSAVRFVSTDGMVSTVAGDGTLGSTDAPAARFNTLAGIAVDGATAYVYLADTGNHRIRRLDPQGAVITIAGAERGFADGSAAQARFADPSGIAVDGSGHLVVADSTNSLVREVAPALTTSGASAAVSTIAGTGDRGITNGAGNLARFFTPRGIAISPSSAIIVTDTGNHVLRRIVLPPRITGFTPASGRAVDTVMIEGGRFDGRSPDRNLVRFTRSAQAGGGTTQAQVTMATRAHLAVIVPADATSGLVTVQTEGGTATSPIPFVVTSGPMIADFNPKSAPVGTLVNVTGTNLAPPAGTAAQVILNKQGGGMITAPVSSAAATNLSFVIPTEATTGPITVTIGGQSATSLATLTIVSSSDFGLTVAPAAADLIQGQSVAYTISLSSNSAFNQLADLNVTGLPSGVTASFKPTRITAGQTSVLTLNAPTGQPTGTAALTVFASSNVDGIALTKSANVTLNIRPVTTSFVGRTVVADTLETPLAGVTIKFLGRDGNGNTTGCSAQTVSDAAGNFAFTNLPSSCSGAQLIRYDGTTASSPPGEYAGVDLVYDIVANQVTVSPVLVHLPRIDNKETIMVRQNASTDQSFAFRTIPGLSATVYAGTTFTLADGTRPDPFPFTAVQVPVDRLPDAKPPNPAMLMVFIVAFQPANTEASQPVAIFYPNTINTPPGTNMVLMTLDPTRGQMVPYGTGTVSNNGAQVIPDFDPAHPGKRFGLIHFDWHGQMPPTPPNPANPSPDGPGPDGKPRCPSAPPPVVADPVDVSSGIQVFRNTDIAINGLRSSISLERTYRSLSTNAGPFGIGTNHNYGFRLNTNTPQAAGVINLMMPDGNRFPFNRQADQTLINTTIPSMIGAVMTTQANGNTELRWKDGTVYRFVPSTFQLGAVLESIRDPNGNRITLTRNPSQPLQITEVIDPVGRRLILNYDAADRITSIADPIGRTVRYTYNGQGILETVTDLAGGVTRYDYDAQNQLIRVTNARGVVIAQNTYDANGRVIQQIQSDGGVWRFAYTLLNPTTPFSPILVTTVTDPMGNQTIYRFNPQGFLESITDAQGQVRIFELESGTNLLLSITGAGSCNACGSSGAGDQFFTYDALGNLATSTDALGNVTRFTYEPSFNKISAITDPLSHVTRFIYDARGNLISSTDENGKVSSFAYNSFGLLSETTDPFSQKTVFSYDGSGNLVATTDPLGNTSLLRYDAVSRPVEVLDPLGKSSKVEYDALDRVISNTNAKNEQVRFSYDASGNLLSVIDARGNTTSFTYNSRDRLATRTSPLGHIETYAYDRTDNLTQYVDRRGQVSNFVYDSLNRLLTETYQDGSRVAYSYDSFSRLMQVMDSVSGIFTFTYDLAGRLTGSANQFGTLRYTRDGLGRASSRQVVGQATVSYSYDPAGNLLTASAAQAAVTYTYDAKNRPVSLARSNGIRSNYTYDALSRVLSLTHANGPTVLNSQSYTYDALGNRKNYATNIAQPLITQAVTNQYDAANRLLQSGATTYTYDNNGNRISEVSPAGTTTYRWDARNRLQAIVTPNGQTTTFLYDFVGNLISQQTVSPGMNVTQSFLLDDLTNVVYQTDSAGNQFSILTGRGIDQHLAVISSGGQVKFGLPDAINSTVAHTRESGAIEGQVAYEPFGQTTITGVDYPFQFTGRTRAPANLYYYRARFYDSIVGRFLSEDPIGFSGGDFNLYRYVANNPINLRDPVGKDTENKFIDKSLDIASESLPGVLAFVPFGRALDERTKALDERNRALLSQDPGCIEAAERNLARANRNVEAAARSLDVEAIIKTSLGLIFRAKRKSVL
jgi:RHS repeat-associated protein